MEELDYWRFCSELTVVQAALLILEIDPTPHLNYISNWKPEEQPPGYVPVFNALRNDIRSKWLEAQIERIPLQYGDPSDDTDWDRTLVSVSNLKEWLFQKGKTTGFFFPDGPVTVDYLDRKHAEFSPKLAAAVNAWKAVRASRRESPSGRSVKADLIKWLNLHAAEFELTAEDGRPNKQAIEDVAKVANWDTKGGAPKTPGN